MKLNSVVFKIGLITQALVLVAFFCTETPILSCPNKNNTTPNNDSEIHDEEKFSKTASNEKPEQKYSWASLISLELSELETKLGNTDFKYKDPMTDWLKYFLLAGGFMTIMGLLIRVFRKKAVSKQYHLCSSTPASTPLSYQWCNQCNTTIKLLKDNKVLSKSATTWVVEITVMSASDRKKISAAIKEMGLPVIRLENNFIVIGPYKNKSEAAELVHKLHETHNVRGWLTQRN